MEAAHQRRERSIELEIPPFGSFRMDLQQLTQTTVRGRNPGYEREIRRQVRKIELGGDLKWRAVDEHLVYR